jgi:hypothetical protein
MELSLSSYSYCVETSRGRAPVATLGDCLFFLFVNPTVLYTVRGGPASSRTASVGWVRLAAGIATMFINVAALRPLAHQLRSDLPSAITAGASVSVAVYGMTTALTIYAAHSGLASIQLGLMRVIGWTVPERYCYPLLSKSPIDFWRRWNTYVRMWLEAYVYLPMARAGRKKGRRWLGPVGAAVTTLAASGALHGAVTFAGRQIIGDLEGEMAFFLGAGLILAAWRIVSLAGNAFRAKLRPIQAKVFDVVAHAMARAGIVAAMLAGAIAWG